jgi:hypothetical protein
VSRKKADCRATAGRRVRRQRPSLPIPAVLQILVECKSEDQQRDLFERLSEEGYSCRVLTL